MVNLTQQLILGLGLAPDIAETMLKQTEFKTFPLFGTAQEYPNEVVIIDDLCEQMPTVAALILLRDSIASTGAQLPPVRGAFLIPLLHKLDSTVFAAMRLVALTKPGYRSHGLRAYNGKLAVTGEFDGEEQLIQEIEAEMKAILIQRLLNQEASVLNQEASLAVKPSPAQGGRISLADFTKTSLY